METENKGCVLMQRYELGRLLGQGTFAKVFHARNIKTSESVAIKVIDKETILKNGLIDQIKREISVMRLVRHPNIVQLFEVMASKNKVYFVLEYIRGGELFDKVSKGRLKVDDARKYFQQLIGAVDFCHSKGVFHRDLKPENLLLDDDGNLKISDFGLSTVVGSKRKDGLLHTTCGTPAYVAPEVINRKGYDGVKSDIWSCGVILYVLMAGYLPFHDSNLMEMYRKIINAKFRFPKWFSPDIRSLITRILDPNPITRITIEKIKENPWFMAGLDPKKMEYEMEDKELGVNAGLDFFESDMAEGEKEGGKQETMKPINLNAFDIISFSAGFDLSGLFEEKEQMREVIFSSNKLVSVIFSELKEAAKRVRFKIKWMGKGLLKMEGLKEGWNGVLVINAEIFEVTPSLHLVEIKKINGDMMEYQKLWQQYLRPSLEDIVQVCKNDCQPLVIG